jgi:hypothetical protein
MGREFFLLQRRITELFFMCIILLPLRSLTLSFFSCSSTIFFASFFSFLMYKFLTSLSLSRLILYIFLIFYVLFLTHRPTASPHSHRPCSNFSLSAFLLFIHECVLIGNKKHETKSNFYIFLSALLALVPGTIGINNK